MQVIPSLNNSFNRLVTKYNKEEYTKGIIDFVINWTCLMEKQLKNDNINEVAINTYETAGFEDITIRMFEISIDIIEKYWVYGKDIKQWYVNSSVYYK